MPGCCGKQWNQVFLLQFRLCRAKPTAMKRGVVFVLVSNPGAVWRRGTVRRWQPCRTPFARWAASIRPQEGIQGIVGSSV